MGFLRHRSLQYDGAESSRFQSAFPERLRDGGINWPRTEAIFTLFRGIGVDWIGLDRLLVDRGD